jgi:hypothetical protein
MKQYLLLIFFVLFMCGCGQVTLVQYQDQEYAKLAQLNETQELVPAIYREAFADQIVFWKDVYITHSWNSLVYFSPDY